MMLSKIILSFTIFVVVRFISFVGTETIECNTDDEFHHHVSLNTTSGFLPVLITDKSRPYLDQIIENTLLASHYYTLIKVYVNENPCPITNEYLCSENKFPSLHVIISNRPFNDAWNPYTDEHINEFIRRAEHACPAKSGRVSTVTAEMAKRIAARNSVTLSRVAGNAMRAAAANPYGWLSRMSFSQPQSQLQPRKEYMFMTNASNTNTEVPLLSVQLGKRDQRSPDNTFLSSTQAHQRQRTDSNNKGEWGFDLQLATRYTVDKGKGPLRH